MVRDPTTQGRANDESNAKYRGHNPLIPATFGRRKQVGYQREREDNDRAIADTQKSTGNDELIHAVQRYRQISCRAA